MADVTGSPLAAAKVMHHRARVLLMDCEFCANELDEDAENIVLLQHVSESEACREQYEFLLENLRTSWTPAMSGG